MIANLRVSYILLHKWRVKLHPSQFNGVEPRALNQTTLALQACWETIFENSRTSGHHSLLGKEGRRLNWSHLTRHSIHLHESNYSTLEIGTAHFLKCICSVQAYIQILIAIRMLIVPLHGKGKRNVGLTYTRKETGTGRTTQDVHMHESNYMTLEQHIS